jgi:23S rRNA U2552 (ribose-2'-O)-methylase RlmE/FtsJ
VHCHEHLDQCDQVVHRLAHERRPLEGLAAEHRRRHQVSDRVPGVRPQDLGKPNISAGQQAKDSVDQLSSDLTTDTDSIKAAVDGASGVRGIADAATTISTTLVTMGKQLVSTFKGLEQLDAKGELQTAFQQSSACQQLSSASPRST